MNKDTHAAAGVVYSTIVGLAIWCAIVMALLALPGCGGGDDGITEWDRHMAQFQCETHGGLNSITRSDNRVVIHCNNPVAMSWEAHE